MNRKVKICGITGTGDARALAEAGADFAGFVFYPPSPRHLSFEQAGRIADALPASVKKAALAVNPDDLLIEEMTAAMAPDYIQLHGSETPERCRHVKNRFSCGIIKALSVKSAADVKAAKNYDACADFILLDAKPAPDALRGGGGRAFDWSLLENYNSALPWFLAGGLTPENVAAAVRQTGAAHLDVSTGVERGPGRKDPEKISRFIQAARMEK